MVSIFRDGTLTSVSSLAAKKKINQTIRSYANIMLEDLYEHQLYTDEEHIINKINFILSRDDDGMYITKFYIPKHIRYSKYFAKNKTFTIFPTSNVIFYSLPKLHSLLVAHKPRQFHGPEYL